MVLRPSLFVSLTVCIRSPWLPSRVPTDLVAYKNVNSLLWCCSGGSSSDISSTGAKVKVLAGLVLSGGPRGGSVCWPL